MFSSLKLVGMFGGLALVVGVYIYINNLRSENQLLNARIDTLKQNVSTLKTAVENEKESAKKMRQDWMDSQIANAKLQASDAASRDQVAKLSEKINSAKKKSQLERVSGGKKASLHLRLVNKGAACQWAHFDDFNGECNAVGVWKEKNNE